MENLLDSFILDVFEHSVRNGTSGNLANKTGKRCVVVIYLKLLLFLLTFHTFASKQCVRCSIPMSMYIISVPTIIR